MVVLGWEIALFEIEGTFEDSDVLFWLDTLRFGSVVHTLIIGISGGVSFLTYLPTTPSFIVLNSLFFLDSIVCHQMSEKFQYKN